MEVFYKDILTDQYLIHAPYINTLRIFGLNLDPRQLNFSNGLFQSFGFFETPCPCGAMVSYKNQLKKAIISSCINHFLIDDFSTGPFRRNDCNLQTERARS